MADSKNKALCFGMAVFVLSGILVSELCVGFSSSVKCPGDFFVISCFTSLLLPARRLAESVLSFPPKKTTGQLSVSVD